MFYSCPIDCNSVDVTLELKAMRYKFYWSEWPEIHDENGTISYKAVAVILLIVFLLGLLSTWACLQLS